MKTGIQGTEIMIVKERTAAGKVLAAEFFMNFINFY